MEKILVLRSTEMTDRSFCPIFFPFLLKGDILKAWLSSARKEPGSLNGGAFREGGFRAPSGEQQGAGEALRLRGRVGSGRRCQGTSQTLAQGPVLGAQSHGRKGQDRRARRGRTGKAVSALPRRTKGMWPKLGEVKKSRVLGWWTCESEIWLRAVQRIALVSTLSFPFEPRYFHCYCR